MRRTSWRTAIRPRRSGALSIEVNGSEKVVAKSSEYRPITERSAGALSPRAARIEGSAAAAASLFSSIAVACGCASSSAARSRPIAG
jgi:hypothetical protein